MFKNEMEPLAVGEWFRLHSLCEIQLVEFTLGKRRNRKPYQTFVVS